LWRRPRPKLGCGAKERRRRRRRRRSGRKWREAEEDCILRSFITCTLHRILLGWSNNTDEMGRARSTNGRDEKCIQNFEGKRPHRRHRSNDRITLHWILGK
jgi:hypothetical protein